MKVACVTLHSTPTFNPLGTFLLWKEHCATTSAQADGFALQVHYTLVHLCLMSRWDAKGRNENRLMTLPLLRKFKSKRQFMQCCCLSLKLFAVGPPNFFLHSLLPQTWKSLCAMFVSRVTVEVFYGNYQKECKIEVKLVLQKSTGRNVHTFIFYYISVKRRGREEGIHFRIGRLCVYLCLCLFMSENVHIHYYTCFCEWVCMSYLCSECAAFGG